MFVRPSILLCSLVLLCALSSFLRIAASPTPASVTIGVVLPLTGNQAWYGQRTKTVIEQLYSDLQSGVALPGLPVNPVGCPISLQFRDSASDPLTSMRHLWDLKTNYPDMIGVIGDLNDNVTLPMTSLATTLNIFSMSPATSAASVADVREYPYFVRTAVNQEVFAGAWIDYAKISKWYRFALLTTDDDTSQGFTDVMQRLAAATTISSAETNATSNPFDITTYIFPGQDGDVTRVVIDQALDALASTDTRIFFLHGGDISEQILRAAYVKGLMGMGRDGIMRQWIGTFCTPEFADIMESEPWILYGTYCIVDPRPSVYDDRPTNAAEVAFQTRLQTANPTYFPTNKEMTWREISAANAFVGFISTMRTVFNNPAVDNSAGSMFAEICGNYHQITQVDGNVVNFLPSGDMKLNPEFVNWDVRRRDWITTQKVDIVADPNNWSPVTLSYTLNNLPLIKQNTPTFANSLSSYPKDRPRVYVEGDDLPLTLSGQVIVLTYVICVLAAWTALILLEQALSFWSRGVWKEAVGWVALASFAFGSCSIWPNMIMALCSIQLDVDARLFLEHPAVIGTAFYPIPGVFICFMLSMTSVLGGLKPAPNVNASEVSEVSSKTSVNSSKSGSSLAHLRILRNAVSKRWQKLIEFCKDVAVQSTWRLPVAGVILSFVMYTEFLILQEYGFYWKVHFVPRIGNVAGGIVLSAAVNIISLAMYFHVTRSSLRYVSPFLLGITTLAQFLIVIEGSRFTYSENVDVTSGAVSKFVKADGTIAAIVAVVCAAICVLLMVFNVNRLRLSRNALDKVLNQVGGQLKTIEAEIEYVKAQKIALFEQADFLRRNLEVINLCRPVWRPYSVALALADAEENSFEKAEALKKAAATGANLVLPNPEKRTAFQSAMKKSSEQSGVDKNKSRNDKEVSESGASKMQSKAAGNNLAAPSAEPEMSESKDANDAVSAIRDDAARKKRLSVDFSAPDESGKGASPTPAKSEKKTMILVAPKPSAAVKEGSSGGSKNRTSKSPPPPAKVTLDDWDRIHASKNPKQLAALLREISDLSNLESPLPSKVIQDIRLPQILSLPSTLELMKDVLGKNLSPENIALWIDIQRFRSLENANIRKAVADEICQTFIASGAKFEVNLSSFMRDYVIAQVNKNLITLDMFDEVEKEIFRLMVTNNVDALSHSNMMKLVAILLMHPQYKLKNMTVVNNARGEIDGNESPLIVMAGATGTGLISASVAPTPLFHARKPSTSISVAPVPVINRPIGNAPGKLSRNPSRG